MLNAVGFKTVVKNDYDTQALISGVVVKHDYDLACWGFNVTEEESWIMLNQRCSSTRLGSV